MGSRNPDNADVWILYNGVKAFHEGMTLHTDSASFDTKNNVFVAHSAVRIDITDTTTLFGKGAIYDGTTRIADVWGDTVTLIDGRTVLKSDLLSYDRNTSTASYFHWGRTVHDSATMTSLRGYYHTDTRDVYLFDEVVLHDTSSWLFTDTLLYNTRTELAQFISPALIKSDSSTVYSEDGWYNTGTGDAASFKATRLTDGSKILVCDTLFYNDNSRYGRAFGHVAIADTANKLSCYGAMGITDQKSNYSFVTDSALLVYLPEDEDDTVFMHADTIYAFNDESGNFVSANAFHAVRVFSGDGQAVCDSLLFSDADSCVSLFGTPVVWYEDYQCSADTIHCFYDTSGIRLALLRNNVLAVEKVDSAMFNQIRGRNAEVHCLDGEPSYADIIGSAQMVYYVMDDEVEDCDGCKELIGVNAGVGSDMRIYFKDRKPRRFVTFGSPDMKMYPPELLPDDQRRLPGFKWLDTIRPVRAEFALPR